MSFNEKTRLRDERTPLIQNPIIWTRSQECNLESDYSYGRSKRKAQFQWIVFIGVTIISFFILLALIGAALKSNAMLPPIVPRPVVPTTTASIVSTSAATLETTASTTTTTTTIVPPILQNDVTNNPVNTSI